MSRSHRRNAVIKDHSKGGKAFANRRVRRRQDVGNHGEYRKHSDSYDISDFCFRCDKPEDTIGYRLADTDAEREEAVRNRYFF